MNSEAELLQKLMISKKIMEKHNDIGRGQCKKYDITGKLFITDGRIL
jgi:hypothetical protein